MLRNRFLLVALSVVGLVTILAACTSGPAMPAQTTPATGPVSGPMTTLGAPVVPNKIGATPIAMIPVDKRTPEQWMEYLGLRLVETRDSSGPAVWTPVDGATYWFSNESTQWGAENRRNGVVIFDAKTHKVVAQSKLPDEYSIDFASHSVGVSADGKWLYLPSHKAAGQRFLLILDARTLKINKVYESTGNPHHVNNITLPDGREAVAIIDFGWNWIGSGLWIIDPAKDNQVVGGMSRRDFSGNPYIISREFGEFLYVGVPTPTATLRDKVEGFLMKVNMKTWKVEAAVPVGDPIWTEITHDGKFAYVTDGGASKVHKIDLAKMQEVIEILTGPGPWGARLSFDETKLYTADKGEGPGLGQQGRTMTVIDTESMIVTNVVPIGVTTDHVLLSPDGKEIWATSNAEHRIYVVDAVKEEVVAKFDMPNAGDTHGGTWVQYTKDAKGELVGEVVSGFSGLRGSAWKKQLASLNGPKATLVRISGLRQGVSGSFAPPSLSVKPGAPVKLAFMNAGGTSAGIVSVASSALNVPRTDLPAGRRTTVDLKAPDAPGKYEFKNPLDPNGKPFVLDVNPNAGAQAQAAAPAGGQRELRVETKNIAFVQTKLTAKAGETVKMTFVNGDDEKHNFVVLDQGIFSPDVNAGSTRTFDLTMPAKPGTYKVVCAYHPATSLVLEIQ